MKLNKNQLSVVKSIIKEEIEKFKSLKEGSWQVITNDEGEPIGKDYVYSPEDPEYYETGDDYNDDRPRSRVGSSVGEKSDVINSIRDILKRNDIYSKIVMSSGRSGRYISIPYNNSNLAIRFVFKRGEGMKIEVGSRLFTDAYEAVDYLLKNSDKNMFKSQSEHESSLKAGAKDRRAQNVKDKEAKKAEQEKLEKLEKIKRIPAIASAIGEHGLYNKRDFKVLFGNTPSKVISATIQDILETMPYDELRKIVKITVDKPKYFSENKKTTKKQITISELRQIIRESIESLDDKVISEHKSVIKEYDNYNYPAGADADSNAPWHEKDDRDSEYEYRKGEYETDEEFDKNYKGPIEGEKIKILSKDGGVCVVTLGEIFKTLNIPKNIIEVLKANYMSYQESIETYRRYRETGKYPDGYVEKIDKYNETIEPIIIKYGNEYAEYKYEIEQNDDDYGPDGDDYYDDGSDRDYDREYGGEDW